MPKNAIFLGGLAALFVSASACASAQQFQWIKDAKDVQIYLKTKYDLNHTWDQEFGVQATIGRMGNFADVVNTAYDPLYPVAFNREPRFTIGNSFIYYFAQTPVRFGVYYKPKYNFVAKWQHEMGFTARIYSSPRLTVTTNLAYVAPSPYIKTSRPGWLALLTFAFPLGN